MEPLDLSGWHGEIAAIGWTLLDFCWQGALIAVAYAAARALWRHQPRARLGAGYLALLALAVTPAITLALRWPAAATGAGDAPVGGMAVAVEAVVGRADIDWLAAIVALWVAGVVILGTRAGWQWLTLRRICAEATPLDADWQARMQSLARRFGLPRVPPLLESARIAAPSLVGWLRPVVLLPAGLCLRLPPAQIELLLAHELAHLRRWDHLLNLLQVVLETALFYHPAVHWISRRVREDREQCCDDLVASVCPARIDYARALLAVAEEHASLPRLALAAGGGQLLARVERIVGADRKRRPRRLGERVLLVAITAAALLFGLQALLLAQRSLPEPWPTQISFDPARIPTPALGLRLGELAPRRPTPPLHPPVSSEDPLPAATGAAAIDLPLPLAVAAPVIPPPPIASDGDATDLAEASSTRGSLPPVASVPAPQPAAATVTDALSVPTVMPLRRAAPQYPPIAELRGIEGSVELSFVIDSRGRVGDIRIEQESHPGVFSHAAERALRRWRYAPADAGPARHRQLFDFRMKDIGGDCPSTGSRICRAGS